MCFVLKIHLARLRGRTPRMAKWLAKYPHSSSHPPRGRFDVRFSSTDILKKVHDHQAVAQKERTGLWKAVKRMDRAQHELLAMRSEPGTWIWRARRTRPQSALPRNTVGLRSSAGRTCRGPPRKRVIASSNLFSMRDRDREGAHHFENEEETVVAAQ